MNSSYERMKALLAPLGISFENGSFADAEIAAYAAGLSLVKQKLQRVFDTVFILISDSADPSLYADLLRLDASRYTDEALKQAIVNRFSHSYADYTCADYTAALEDAGISEYWFNDSKITCANVAKENRAEMGKLSEGYFPLTGTANYYGYGMTFTEWGVWNLNCNELDGLCLQFEVIENLLR